MVVCVTWTECRVHLQTVFELLAQGVGWWGKAVLRGKTVCSRLLNDVISFNVIHSTSFHYVDKIP